VRIRFWGSRGSLPCSTTAESLRKKIKNVIQKADGIDINSEAKIEEFLDNELQFSERGSYGCNTSCVEIVDTEQKIICDCGTGLRDLGNDYMKAAEPKTNVFNIFISHLHYDHLQGFPFFVPAYIAGNQIKIFGCHPKLEEAFKKQMQYPFFPVRFDELESNIEFTLLEPGKEYKISGYKIKAIKQNHPGDSYGYEFVKGGKKFVYSTDAEHNDEAENPDYEFINFFRNADLLVFDAQYDFSNAQLFKLNWGHSSNLIGVELAVRANVKRLVLFHSEHTFNDEEIENFLEQTRRYKEIHEPESKLEIFTAYDGLELQL